MKTTPVRLTLYAADIMHITGKSMRTARRLIRHVKLKYGIPPRTDISVEQFCSFTGFSEDKVNKFIQ